MKILHATPYFAPAYIYGGPPRSVLGLCRALSHAGVDVSVVSTSANGDRELDVPTSVATTFEGLAVRYVARGFPRRYFGVRGFGGAAAEMFRGVSLVHLHGCWNVLTWRTAAVCRRMGIPYVLSPRGMLTPWSLEHSGLRKRLALELVERRVLDGAHFIHATSEEERHAIEEMKVTRPIAVIPNGIDAPLPAGAGARRVFRERFSFGESDVVVLYLGRVHPKKGIESLAAACRLARTRHPRLKLLIAGHGDPPYEASLRARFADLTGEGAMIFGGHLEDAARASAFACADLFALTSHSENFALSVGEAMAAGLAVVVSRECPWPQIEEWNAGRWVVNEVAAIAAALEELAGSRELRRHLGENGQAGVAAHLTWDAVAEQMLTLYARAVQETRVPLRPAVSHA